MDLSDCTVYEYGAGSCYITEATSTCNTRIWPEMLQSVGYCIVMLLSASIIMFIDPGDCTDGDIDIRLVNGTIELDREGLKCALVVYGVVFVIHGWTLVDAHFILY